VRLRALGSITHGSKPTADGRAISYPTTLQDQLRVRTCRVVASAA
jgi:hypothetical protein